MSEAHASEAPTTDARVPARPAQEEMATASRPSSEAAAPRFSTRARLRPAPLGRLGRGLVYGTGLFLLRPLLLVVRRLLGWERRAEITLEDTRLCLTTDHVALGTELSREEERLPTRQLVSVATTAHTAPEPLALGALVAGIAVIWGFWQIVDGIFGRSGGLVSLGLLALLLGVAFDLAVLWASRFIPGIQRHGVILRTRDGRIIGLDGMEEHSARRLRDELQKTLQS